MDWDCKQWGYLLQIRYRLKFDNDVKRLVKIKDTLWIGTVNGLNFIDLKGFIPPYFKPQIDIKSVKSNGQLVKGLNIPHKDNNIEVLLSGLNLNDKHQIDFEYKIEGVSSNWNKLYLRRLKLEGLSPGDYNVKFRAQNRNTLISSEIKSFVFTISPLLCKTWWFITLLILFIISIVVFIFTLRIKELRKKTFFKKKLSKMRKKL